MGSYGIWDVTCHRTRVNTLRLNTSQSPDRPALDLFARAGNLHSFILRVQTLLFFHKSWCAFSRFSFFINVCYRVYSVLKVVGGCTCRCCLERRRGQKDDDEDTDDWDSGGGGRSSPWDVHVVYVDSETRSEFDYRDVESIKRCRRRKSRIVSQQRRPVVVLRDTADRYISYLSPPRRSSDTQRLSVCWFVSRIIQKRKGGLQASPSLVIRFWWRSGSGSGSRIGFKDSLLFTIAK